MNFGHIGILESLFVLLLWAIPVILLGWFIRTLTSMSASQREIAERLAGIEAQLRRGAPLN